jgi:TonB family protein
MNYQLPFILLAAAVIAQPVVSQAQSSSPTKLLAETFRVERYVEPGYPVQLRNKNIGEGYAQVQLLVAADGTLLETFISAYSRREFAESAERAISNWKFRPAADPSALPQRFNLRIDFRREGMLLVQGDFQETVDNFLGHKDLGSGVALSKLSELDATPEILNLVVPEYPAELKKQNITGSAAVSFFIDENGQVHTASVVSSSRQEFAAAALNAVKQWTFAPPMHKGNATRVFAVQEFTFTPSKSQADGKAGH